MGYVKNRRTDRLVLPSAPDFWVEMKQRITYGDRRHAQAKMLSVTTVDLNEVSVEDAGQVTASADGKTGVLTKMEVSAFMNGLLESVITDWNLTDESEQKLPITSDSLDMLEVEDGEYLAAEATKRMEGRAVEAEVPFATPSREPSRAESVTTLPQP